eukprot:GHVP01024166.1.p1 GENE.GHVP01024166.1~~GHVP01024166.1.p1  ORF type:complete len:143 (-),score=29.46 GHVP01024166.1:1350-1778(-)
MINNESKRGVVYISRVPSFLTVFQLKEHFERIGKVKNVHFSRHKLKQTVRGLGEGWVEFETEASAIAAANLLNGNEVSTNNRKFKGTIWTVKFLEDFLWSQLSEESKINKMERREKTRINVERNREDNENYRKRSRMPKKKN